MLSICCPRSWSTLFADISWKSPLRLVNDSSWTWRIRIACVSVSCDCYNKVPQTCWLNTTEIHFLSVLEDRSPKLVSTGLKPRCQQGWTPSRDSRGESILCWAAHVPWNVATSLPSLLLWSRHLFCVSGSSLCLPCFPKGHVTTFRAHLDNPRYSPHLKTFHLITSAKILFPYKVTTFTGPRN